MESGSEVAEESSNINIYFHPESGKWNSKSHRGANRSGQARCQSSFVSSQSTRVGFGLGLTLFFVGLLGEGCATTYPDVPERHILQFHRHGFLEKPSIRVPPRGAKKVPLRRGRAPILSKESENEYIRTILDGMDKHAREEQQCSIDKPCRLLLFIHGGLNSNHGSIRRVLDLVCSGDYAKEPCDLQGPILSDKDQYPIFVNWNSSLISSYGSHLSRVQRGRDIDRVGELGVPFKFLADTGRALARAPIVHYEMISHDLRTVGRSRMRRVVERDAEEYYKSLFCAYDQKPKDNSPVTRCNSDTEFREKISSFVKYVTGFPFKLVLAPIIDQFGTVSWDILLRRTEILFEEEIFCAKQDSGCAFELVPEQPYQRVRAGGLARFLDRLDEKIKKDRYPWEITLIGHSMGAIITNRILQRYPKLPIKNVVYMASASTVKDYKDSAFPLLERDCSARVFHLVLSPGAELRERFRQTDWGIIDIAPRGSLLVWIDNFLSKANSMEDRTAGRFANITRAMASTPKNLKPRVHLAVFGVGREVDDWQPQKHGDFARSGRDFSKKYQFWKEEFWLPDFSPQMGCTPHDRDVCQDRGVDQPPKEVGVAP